MHYLKKLTRSITMILVVILVFGAPILFGRVCRWLGLITWIDSWWAPTLWGWALTIGSRTICILCWIYGGEYFVNRGEEGGWFWFKPSYRRKKEPSVDKSETIITRTVFAVLVFIVFEFLFRLGTGVNPPYLLPPGE